MKTEQQLVENQALDISRFTIPLRDDFAINFADWKDNNFLVYKDKTNYAKTSSQYFDVTKYVGKEKPTKYYTTKELLELYKKENESNLSR